MQFYPTLFALEQATIRAFEQIEVTGVNTTKTLYVDQATGSDANSGDSPAEAFATITAANQRAAGGLWSGKILISVAAGTYNENLVAMDMVGKNVPSESSLSGIVASPSIIEIRGDTSTPGNVILKGDGSNLATFVMFNTSTCYKLNGLEIQGTGSSRGIYVAGNKCQLHLDNMASSAINNFLYTMYGASVFYGNGAGGGTHANTTNFIISQYKSVIRIDRGLTITGISSTCISLASQSLCYLNTSNQTWNFTRSSTSATAFFQANEYGTIFKGFGSNDTVNITGATTTVPIFRTINGGIMYVNGGGSCTINASDCTGGWAWIDTVSVFLEVSTTTYAGTGTTSNTYRIYDGACCLSLTNFSNSTPVKYTNSVNYTFGYDFRYWTKVAGHIPGSALTAGSGNVTKNGTQTNEFPLYVAEANETVEGLRVASRVGSGSGHTDQYVVQKNGVDTSMSVSLTNAAAGSTTSNSFTLVAGDRVSIRFVPDAATTAQDVIAQLKIRVRS